MPLNPARPSDSMLGRPEAAEDFGVPLPAEGLPNWKLNLLLVAAAEVVYVVAWALITFLRPTKPATGGEGLFVLIGFGYTVAVVVAFVLLTAAAARRARNRQLRHRG